MGQLGFMPWLRNRMTGANARGTLEEGVAFFTRAGYSVAQAAGIAANLMKESGLDPGAFNPAGGGQGARGIAQWRGDRIRAIEAQFGKPINAMSFQEQLEAVRWELATRERGADARLRAETTPGGAARSVMEHFERPEVELRPRLGAERAALAERVAAGVTVNQTTNINVAPGPTAEETARRVGDAQGRVNADLARNAQGAVR
jgi:hypothetical protein